MNAYDGTFGLSRRQMEDVLATAGLAPSLHNSQPWRFRIEPQAVTLVADRARRLPVADPDDRELRLACGAALFTLRLALHGLGVRPLVTVLAASTEPDVIAVVRCGGHRPATPEQRRLLEAVPRRHTNRRPFSDAPVTPSERQALQRAVQAEDAWMYIVDDPAERAQLHELASTAHRIQMADPAFRDELERWTAVGDDRTDGVPADAGGPLPSPADGWVQRDFAGGTAAPLGEKAFEREPLLVVLTSHLAGARADVQVGQALQRLLLTATADGLAASFLSQIVEVEQTRNRLRLLIRAARPPQIVLRLGHGYPIGATPRRDVAEVLVRPADVQGQTADSG